MPELLYDRNTFGVLFAELLDAGAYKL